MLVAKVKYVQKSQKLSDFERGEKLKNFSNQNEILRFFTMKRDL